MIPTASELSVSRETYDRLTTYAGLLEKWTPRINLVARSTLGDLWARHFRDSLQVLDAADSEIGHWADLGSGGGFPGLVIAICAAESGSPARVSLVESDLRKATFLRTVLRELGLEGQVIAQRIESIAPLGADMISARALADLPRLFSLAEPHLSEKGACLFQKGINWRSEVQSACKTWQFAYDAIPSTTESGAVILKVKGLERV